MQLDFEPLDPQSKPRSERLENILSVIVIVIAVLSVTYGVLTTVTRLGAG
jgi:hypothetical protein